MRFAQSGYAQITCGRHLEMALRSPRSRQAAQARSWSGLAFPRSARRASHGTASARGARLYRAKLRQAAHGLVSMTARESGTWIFSSNRQSVRAAVARERCRRAFIVKSRTRAVQALSTTMLMQVNSSRSGHGYASVRPVGDRPLCPPSGSRLATMHATERSWTRVPRSCGGLDVRVEEGKVTIVREGRFTQVRAHRRTSDVQRFACCFPETAHPLRHRALLVHAHGRRRRADRNCARCRSRTRYLRQMEFAPIIRTVLGRSTIASFRMTRGGLREFMLRVPLERRFTYDAGQDVFFINFDHLAIDTRRRRPDSRIHRG